jgi:hypothetical protein
VLPEEDPSDLSFYQDEWEEKDPNEDESPSEDIPDHVDGKYTYRIQYSDNWKILAARSFMRDKKLEPAKIFVWNADTIRMTDKIPPKFLGRNFVGYKNRIRFSKIKSLEAKMHLIKTRTFWGKTLVKYASTTWEEKKIPDQETKQKLSCRNFCSNLLLRIERLLGGKPDPNTSSVFRERIFGTSNPVGNQKSRAERFLQMLRTVDGCFVQRYLAFPEESWTWEKYDSFVISMISFLIPDEFFDGEIKVNPKEIISAYAVLKRVRKQVKLCAHTRTKFDIHPTLREHPQLGYWKPMIDFLSEASGVRYIRITGLLSQTRGCGTPPPIVILQSKLKFLQTVTEKLPPADETILRLAEACVDSVIEKIPESAFTGLSTKGRISISTSACIEYTRKEGGTVQGLQDIAKVGSMGIPVPIRNLDTGKVERLALKDELTTGEYIFWQALDYVLKTHPDELRRAHILVVKEPGKGRTVTKGYAFLKMILDLVGRICSHPLAKGLESSKSGMARSNQAWQFFKLMMANHEDEIFFNILDRDIEEFIDGHLNDVKVYNNVFLSSTDFETATDAFDHDLGRIFGEKWMIRCGIPPLLRLIVSKVAFQPRELVFNATGWMASIGDPIEGDLRKITLRRGILMGDPMTKPILHLANASIRELPNVLRDFGKLSLQFANAAEMVGKVLQASQEA